MAKPPAIRPVGQDQLTRILVHGDSGVGKTTLAGSGGKGTIIVRPYVDHIPSTIIGNGAEEWVTHDWNEMLDVLEYARHEGKQYDWWWLDSISLFQDVGLDDLWADVLDKKPARRDFGLDRGEYRVNMWRLQEWVRHMIGCNQFNFGITAHSFWMDYTDDEGELQTKMWPWVQGKNMPQKLCGYMNVVGYMEVKEVKRGNVKRLQRVLHTHASERFIAKEQYGAFGDEGDVINPTIPKMMESINAVRAAGSRRRRTRRER